MVRVDDVLECTLQRALSAQLDSDYSLTVMNFLIFYSSRVVGLS